MHKTFLSVFVWVVVAFVTIYPSYGVYRTRELKRQNEHRIARVFQKHLPSSYKQISQPLARHLLRVSQKYQMDPALILAMIEVESGFRPDVKSYAGAVGLMQLMPATAQLMAHKAGLGVLGKRELRDPFLNLTLGCAYFSELRERYQGLSPYFAFAAYNMGPYRLDQLRSKPGFKPLKTMKYFKDITRRVAYWQINGSKSSQFRSDLLTKSTGPLALK